MFTFKQTRVFEVKIKLKTKYILFKSFIYLNLSITVQERQKRQKMFVQVKEAQQNEISSFQEEMQEVREEMLEENKCKMSEVS